MRWLGCVLFCARTSLVWIFNCASLGLRQPRPGGDTDSLDVLLIPDKGHPSWYDDKGITFYSSQTIMLLTENLTKFQDSKHRSRTCLVSWVGVQVSSLCKKFWALEHLPSDSLDKETRYNCRNILIRRRVKRTENILFDLLCRII